MKGIIGLIVSILFSFFFVSPAFAQPQKVEVCPKDSNFAFLCELTGAQAGSVVEKVIVILLILSILIALFFLIWGGIKWIFSGGDKTAVESARNHIVAAIVGLIIALAAFFILQLILGFFGVKLGALTLPSLK